MFDINGIKWDIEICRPYDPKLKRSNGSYTYGVTDANEHKIYISSSVCGDLLKKVLCHELCHCYIISHNIYIPIEIEEYICDAICSYGENVLDIFNNVYTNLKKYYRCGEQ